MQKLKEEAKRGICIMIFSILIILILTSTVSAGWIDWLKKTITGKDVETVTINISVGGPAIQRVYNSTITDVSEGLTAGPGMTNITINFSVNIASGIANLDNGSARINFSKSGYTTRENLSCIQRDGSGNDANYTCNVRMWWWDGAGAWTITAFINDSNGNGGINGSTTFSVGSTTGFDIGPSVLTWSGLSPGTTNQTSNNDPIIINNTGNNNITSGNIQINSTDLLGETTTTQALWASNFTVSWANGGTPPVECGSTASTNMTNVTLTGITGANLSADNFTKSNGVTGQEQLYFCIREVGSGLSTQYYSTVKTAPWTIKIS